jgi:hypothetical protein
MQQIARSDTIDVCKTTVRARLQIQTRQQLEQAPMGTVCHRNRERLFVEGRDIAIGEIAQQPAQPALLGIVSAQAFEFSLEVLESPQPVMLLRKPSI